MEIIELLENQGDLIRNNWPCNDGIKNGSEQDIDCGSTVCPPCDGQTDFDCNESYIQTHSEVDVNTYYYAQDSVLSEHDVTGASVLFQAGDNIKMHPGFSVSEGTVFIADIADCDETDINDSNCTNDNSLSFTNVPCCATPSVVGTYSETVANGVRSITSNNFPNHQYCYRNNSSQSSPMNYSFVFTVAARFHIELRFYDFSFSFLLKIAKCAQDFQII